MRSAWSLIKLTTVSALSPLVPLAIANRVAMVFGIWWARSAKPYALANSLSRPRSTDTTPAKPYRSATRSIASDQDSTRGVYSHAIPVARPFPAGGLTTSQAYAFNPHSARFKAQLAKRSLMPQRLWPGCPGASRAGWIVAGARWSAHRPAAAPAARGRTPGMSTKPRAHDSDPASRDRERCDGSS
jgi:hypothetical protein